MLSWIRAGWSIASFPVVAAWKGYSALWWAFEDDLPKAAQGGAAAAAPEPGVRAQPVPSFAVQPKRAAPTKALKRGFVASLVTGAVGSWAMSAAYHAGNLSEPKAVLGAVWIMGAACVASLLVVRRGERRRASREAQPSPMNTIKRGLRGIGHRGSTIAAAARRHAARFATSRVVSRLVR